jgi:hypothetical protein
MLKYIYVKLNRVLAMQKLISALLFILLLICPIAAKAAYVIKLKNGKEFVTGRYWHEGRQVMFDTSGGVFGIDRSFVTTIEESNKPLKLISTVESLGETKPQVAAKEEMEHKRESSPAGPKSEIKRAADPMLSDFDALREKSKGLNGMLTSELQEFSKNLTELKRRIQLSGKSNDYLGEFAEISEMGDMVETALKRRR